MNNKIVASVFPFESHPKSKALFHIEFEEDTPEPIIIETVEDEIYMEYGDDYPYILKLSKPDEVSDYYNECVVCGRFCVEGHN